MYRQIMFYERLFLAIRKGITTILESIKNVFFSDNWKRQCSPGSCIKLKKNPFRYLHFWISRGPLSLEIVLDKSNLFRNK